MPANSLKTPRPDPRDGKVIFALAPADAAADGIPTLFFLMPKRAWDYMQGGLGHDFDLTKIGIPIRVSIGRCNTWKHGLAILAPHLAGAQVKDVTDLDLSFGEPPEKAN